MNPVELMTLPFLECLVLVGIHSYLGIHVIKREVIFVDLALAQIAALGTTVAYLFGIHPHSTGSYVFSLFFTFLAAGIFALTRLRRGRVPQEAVIGLVYALAAAVAILVIDRAPHGAEHIKEILTGSILWVRGRTVATAAVVYALVGLFHYLFRERFLLISENVEEAYRRGIRVRLWDFLFYISFGLVITHSVNTAGVLLVFVFLVVPAMLAVLLTDRILLQLLVGWGLGTLVSLVGLTLSYLLDLPSGPAVVSFYGLVLLAAAVVLYVVRSERRSAALAHVAAGVVVVGLVGLLVLFAGRWFAARPELALPSWRKAPAAPVPAAHPRHGAHHGHPPAGARSLLEEAEGMDFVTLQAWLARIPPERIERELLPGADRDPELELAVGLRLLQVRPAEGRAVLERFLQRRDVPPFLLMRAREALAGGP